MDAASAQIIEFVEFDPSKVEAPDYIIIGDAEQSHQPVLKNLLSSIRVQVWKYAYDIERLQDNFIFLPALAIFLYFVLRCFKSANNFISPNACRKT